LIIKYLYNYAGPPLFFFFELTFHEKVEYNKFAGWRGILLSPASFSFEPWRLTSQSPFSAPKKAGFPSAPAGRFPLNRERENVVIYS
jgi:hypothetical protein